MPKIDLRTLRRQVAADTDLRHAADLHRTADRVIDVHVRHTIGAMHDRVLAGSLRTEIPVAPDLHPQIAADVQVSRVLLEIPSSHDR
ncbi:hypothetical protein WK69_30795, partial [Burkholderia ubonensis]